MICNHCRKEIESMDLFCRFCGSRQDIQEKITWNADHFPKIKGCYGLPQVLEGEYNRIFSLLDDGQTYGAVLQMRDVYEIALKLPTIVALAYICHKSSLGEKEYLIIEKVVEKELSSGSWHSISRMMKKVVEEPDVRGLLEEADELWTWDGTKGMRGNRNPINNFTGFTHWRNSTIGHGALAFDDQKDFFTQFQKMIELLNRYIENTCDRYDRLSCEIRQNEVTVSRKENIFSLYPFMILVDGGIYFFDSFLYGKRKYDVLNYQDANKISNHNGSEIEKRVEELYCQTKAYLEKIKANNKLLADQNSIYTDWHTRDEEDFVENFSLSKKIYKVEYLTRWLSEKIRNESKIYILAMQSGLGKSTWCRTLIRNFAKR